MSLCVLSPLSPVLSSSVPAGGDTCSLFFKSQRREDGSFPEHCEQWDSGSVAPETRLNFALRSKSRPAHPGSQAKSRSGAAEPRMRWEALRCFGRSFRAHQAGSGVPDTLVPAGAERTPASGSQLHAASTRDTPVGLATFN